jgi:sugar transferase EpsL
MKDVNLIIKKLSDVVISVIAVMLLSPVILAVAVIVKLKSGGLPVIFRQTRPGLHGRLFELYKFRTMTDERDDAGMLLPDEERLGRWGIFLRSLSLDELPQFINVIKGDMSIIGPRPLLAKYMELYTPEQKRRHDMRPGLTGLTAVQGRNSLSWDKRFYYDIWYVDHWSLTLDIKIAFKTIYTAFFSKKGNELSSEFKGGTDDSQPLIR